MSLLGHDITPYVQLTRVQKYGGVLLIFWPFGAFSAISALQRLMCGAKRLTFFDRIAWSLTMAASTANLSFSKYLVGLAYAFVFSNLLRR
jgi:4-hydroxybenzoate polyprenyltransferase